MNHELKNKHGLFKKSLSFVIPDNVLSLSKDLIRNLYKAGMIEKFECLVLFFILSFSLFFRLYKIPDFLGFWYDQGRDALVIWDLLHKGKLFLIGPVTGIDGIFLGPFYYYLIAPFYWLGKGDPVIVSIAVASMDVITVFLIYLLGKRIYGTFTGLLAAFLYGFSYNIVLFSRWLSNPAPLPLFTMFVLLSLYSFIGGSKKSLILASFFIGLCLQLEAASAIFFIPATLIIVCQNRKNINLKILLLSLAAFFITLLPQIYFNFRHDGILMTAFRKFLIEDKSFKINLFNLAKSRIMIYYDTFLLKIFPVGNVYKIFTLASFSALMIFFKKKVFNKGGKFLSVWIMVPILGFLFYQGNHGYLWNYYFTGVIPSFIILFSAGLNCFLAKNNAAKIIVLIFLLLFAGNNIFFLKGFYGSGVGISLKAEKKAIDYIYQDVGKEDFNVDIYVPPVIFDSYTYLFKWYGVSKYGREPNTNLVKNLYTLSEKGGLHPLLLRDWLKRQDKIGKIVKDDFSSGGIAVQKRERILYEKN